MIDLDEAVVGFPRSLANIAELVPVVGMLTRVIGSTTTAAEAVPDLDVRLAESWAGWPDDTERSGIPLELTFPGPGQASGIRISGGWRGESRAFDLAVNDPVRSGEPWCYNVNLNNPGAPDPILEVTARYDWGPVRGASRTFELMIQRTVFSGYLSEHGVTSHEFPNPFVVDQPLNREQVLTNLFQGRDQQLAEIRLSYGRSGFGPTPVCFYGLRKTGKTSLLKRALIEIEAQGHLGVEVSLYGLRADKLDLNQLCLGLLAKSRDAAIDAGIQAAQLDVPESHPNAVMLVDRFFGLLADCTPGRRIVILLDEFQFLLWVENGEPLLDCSARFTSVAGSAS